MPGSQGDRWSVGPVLEYGDGRRTGTSGAISPIPGGTVAKLLAWTEGDHIKMSLLGASFSSNHQINYPYGWSTFTQLVNRWRAEFDEFLINGHVSGAGVDSSTTLKPEEYGLRLFVAAPPL